jgi:protein-S-isoprenylcysteine O-methyltransferase Ste14
MATQSNHGGADVRLPPPLVFLALVGIGVAVQRFAWPVAPPLPLWPRAVAGSVVGMAGLGIGVLAGSWLKRTGQDLAPWKPSPELVVRGIYRYTRNPMYAGMTLIQLGIGIAVGNVWIAAFAPISLLLVHFLAVRHEEAYLEDKFGENYARYKASVRRYL